MYIDKALETLRHIYAQKEKRTRKLRSEKGDETQRQKKCGGRFYVVDR